MKTELKTLRAWRGREPQSELRDHESLENNLRRSPHPKKSNHESHESHE